MTKQEADFIGSMNMCDEISNEAYKKIMCNCEVEEQQPCDDCVYSTKDSYCQYDDITEAISPLEPCDDCISREDTLNKINALIAEYIPLMPIGWTLPLNIAKVINDLPPVTPPQTRWISVSEKLPEKTDYYLIQYSREVCPDEMAVAFYSVEEAEVDSNYTWEFKPIADCKEVIAWRPLPKPCKVESEGV